MNGEPSVLKQVAQLKDMDTPSLKAFWQSHFGDQAPNSNRAFLRQHLIHAVQERVHGTFDKHEAQLVADLANDKRFVVNQGNGRIVDGKDLSLGTKLVRQYNGRDHVAIVVPNGFEYESVFYRSLSAIAKTITGTKWNGLVFFGIKKTRSSK